MSTDGAEATGEWTQRGTKSPLTFSKKNKPTPEPKIVGKEQIWEGKLPLGAGLEYRFVLRPTKTESGEIRGKLNSLDEGFNGLKVHCPVLALFTEACDPL